MWSSLVLAAGETSKYDGDGSIYSKFVIIVRWKSDQVPAKRKGSCTFGSEAKDKRGLETIAESLEQRRVRLV